MMFYEYLSNRGFYKSLIKMILYNLKLTSKEFTNKNDFLSEFGDEYPYNLFIASVNWVDDLNT